MAHEKIVTMFSTVAQAEGAKRNLAKAGFSESDIDIISGDRLRSEGHEARHPSLWQRLFGDTVDEEQAGVYENAMNSGGVVLTLKAKEEELPRAMGILDAHDSVDMPHHGFGNLTTDSPADRQYGNADIAAPALDDSRPLSEDKKELDALEPVEDSYSVDRPHHDEKTVPLRASLTGDETEADVLRLAEERLEVGKRLVSEGSTRVRRYTVTDEVSEDISLQEQHADIFRRSINEPGAPNSIDWSEKTVEIAESHEQPVINKTAHVKEEVVVRKDITDRVETVKDSVRHQEVDIDRTSADNVKSGGVGQASRLDAEDDTTRIHSDTDFARELDNIAPAGTSPRTKEATFERDRLDESADEGMIEKADDKVTDLKNKAQDKFGSR
ncbi:YsnF/AvaK domain-containing protein [Rouxiella chamberiensis]|uniref:YsnF/AvaK domain-containing protein n=1 Tax=Rouxiella chamberiensis TaxID=1513468 RepID=UPI0005D34C8D|nr:YsnF/AvaK domain-containing protein [Rouxiella chamberiensis]